MRVEQLRRLPLQVLLSVAAIFGVALITFLWPAVQARPTVLAFSELGAFVVLIGLAKLAWPSALRAGQTRASLESRLEQLQQETDAVARQVQPLQELLERERVRTANGKRPAPVTDDGLRRAPRAS
jgi:hypothetical protein